MAVSMPLARLILSLALKFIPLLLSQRISAVAHRISYRSTSAPLNVIVLGGSYTGVQLARRLAETLSTGYRVILIERKTHFNHLFNFPRYAVAKGREERAFIPYDGIGKNWLVPEGIFEKVTGTVTKIGSEEVEMLDGQRIPFAFLAVCTGATLPKPGTLRSSGKEDSCAELQDMQMKIEKAARIAIVGGGAVGVQISGDIKSFYPDKEVVLVHSREHLLSGFGKVLGDFVKGRLEAIGVKVVLEERPKLSGSEDGEGEGELVFKDGTQETFDLVIPCTGQKPNSSLIAAIYPDCISPTTGEILVKSTLQITSASTSSSETSAKIDADITPSSSLLPLANCPPNIFALGDVALTHGPKMARASFLQADIVVDNILSLIHTSAPSSTSPEVISEPKLAEYTPMSMEGAVSLSLGLNESVSYLRVDDETEFLWPGKGKGLDLEVKKMWWMMGSKMDVKESAGVGKGAIPV